MKKKTFFIVFEELLFGEKNKKNWWKIADTNFKKTVELSAKFTILILWSLICIPLILLLALMKLASTSVATICNSMENSYPWQNPRVRVKWSDRGPFILILDWMLVYASSTMWMNLSPYPNLWKGEKLKSQLRLRILQKDFYSVYDTSFM